MHRQYSIDRPWAAVTPTQRALQAVVMALVGSMLLAASAKVQIPFWPVPLTMQTFVVMVLGLSYGPRMGVATVALYLLEGALGMPVFAHGAGLAYLTGPTAGYLLGFLPATLLMGHLADRGWQRGVVRAMAAALAGDAVMFACGVSWLAVLIGPSQAISSGFLPFLPGDLLKIIVAGLAVTGATHLAERRRANAGQ